MKRSNYKAIDVFAGCGGLSCGLHRANFKVLAGVEIRSEARMTYLLNYPDTVLFEDVKKVEPADILKKTNLVVGELDLLAGCPPCQGFSTMRTLKRKKSVDDPRNELIFEFLRLIVGLLPKTVMLENVPGLLSDWRLEKTKDQLKSLGYKTAEGVVNAADYGVPQRRRRMILMASRLGEIEIPSNKIKKWKTVRETIESLPPPEKAHRKLHRIVMKHGEEVMRRIRCIPKNGGSRSALGDEQLKCHKKLKAGFCDVYGRMSWDKVAPTITRSSHNPSKGRFLHPEEDRAISLYEAALLQSFPRSYKFPTDVPIAQIASMIGEALPPLLAETQASYLAKHLNKYCSG